MRAFVVMPLNDSRRAGLREKIVRYLETVNATVIRRRDYDATVRHFYAYTTLYRPSEFTSASLPQALAPIARVLWVEASQRGDEARALSAIHALALLAPAQPALARKYQTVVRWGWQAREGRIEAPGGYREVLQIWEEHARLTPSKEVLRVLSKLYLDRKRVIVEFLNRYKTDQELIPLETYREQLQFLGGGLYELVGIYLRALDLPGALQELDRTAIADEQREQLRQVLREAAAEPSRADALIVLVQAYLERQRFDVALALCQLGAQNASRDPRFPICLARMSAIETDYPDTVAWYRAAVQLAPNNPRVYDEALSTLGQLMERRVFETDASQMRYLADSAEQILNQRRARWPKQKSPVGVEKLDLIIGRAELNAGHLDAARLRFARSLKERESAEALLQLGNVEERLNQHDAAIRLLARALVVVTPNSPEHNAERAEIYERLGDIYRRQGKTEPALNNYQKASQAWKHVPAPSQAQRLALIQLRQAILEDRLGHRDRAKILFQAATDTAPGWRELYAQVLSHLVTAMPEVDLARKLLRKAQRQLTLAPEWKVYFALWVQIISGRASAPADEEARAILDSLARQKAWWSKLAGFGAGHTSLEGLLHDAKGPGEQTEAYFYQGARLLAQNRADEAKALFKKVIALGMVGFYEYMMAQEFLTLPPSSTKPAAAHQ